MSNADQGLRPLAGRLSAQIDAAYSVTTYSTSIRVSVAICTRGTIQEIVAFLAADFSPINDLPPFEKEAPFTKSNCPPDPLHWCSLINSAFTWP